MELDTAAMEHWAGRIREAMAVAPKWHGDRVFISDLKTALGFRGEAFGRALVQLHRAGLITLRRLDLVQAVDPETVRRSRTVDEIGTVYHLVVV